MRYPASEKLEIIHLVERSHLPIKQTLDKLGIPRTTFYRWYDRYQVAGPEALEDQSLPIRLTPMTATCRVPPLSRVKLGIGWSRGVARDAEQ